MCYGIDRACKASGSSAVVWHSYCVLRKSIKLLKSYPGDGGGGGGWGWGWKQKYASRIDHLFHTGNYLNLLL